ncbi:hypothetical protein Asd1617_03252 [Shigella dysenteriae 1617]|uniref:Uncharacterized protein n=1 Tax=Shigella dysenteriae 1617 TaxID=754093 RepID=A0A0A6ZW53_SHIDY|nr:hypothetical protein Asd1617_03252 [Shigella dysenteriae 1617]
MVVSAIASTPQSITSYAIQHRHDHQRRLGQLWPGGAEG